MNRKATFEKYAPELSSAQISPVLRNILSNWLCYLIYFAISFFLSPFVVRRLGDSGYGIWTLTLSVTGYLGLLDLGVRGAVTRYVAKFHAQAADDQASRVVSSSLMIFLATGVIAIVSSGVLALSVVGVLNIPASYQPTAKIVVILTGINVAVSLVSGVFGGVVTALQRSDLSNGLQIIGTVFRSVAIVLVLSQGRGLVSLAVVHLVFGVLTGLAYWVLALRLYPGLKINFGRCDMESVKLIFWISAYSLPLQGATYLIFYTDSVVISSFLPISAVTFFAIAGNLVGYGRSLLAGISTISSPLASALEAKGDLEGLKRVLLKGSRLASMVFLPIGITLLLRGDSFVGLWMGPSYAVLTGNVLVILTLAQLIASGNCVPASVTMGIGRHKGMVPAVLAEALCNLVLSILLVRRYGIIGVALGTALPNLAVHLFFWPWFIRRVYGVRPINYVLSTWIRPGLAALPFALCTYAVQKWWPATNVWVFLLQVALAVPIALFAFWFLCVTREERSDYSQKLLKTLLSSSRIFRGLEPSGGLPSVRPSPALKR